MDEIQLYAKIKKSSKYYYQRQWAIDGGFGYPFPVEIKNICDHYCVYGATQQYRISDVNFFVIVEGKKIKLGGR